MKIIVTGANGQLGQELMQINSAQQITGLTRAQLDITQTGQIQAVLDAHAPGLIINAAAYTQVDKAEQAVEEAFAVNAQGAANLAHYCAQRKIPLMHLSTDYVFSGRQTTPYREEDSAQPVNVYGQSKLAGEQAIQQALDNYIILRVSGVFGFYGNNFVQTILKLARERELLRVIADTVIAPTPAYAIAEALLKISDFIKNKSFIDYAGLYHFCSNEPVSWYVYAKEIIKQAALYETLQLKEIQAVSATEYPTPAKRPPYSVLDTSKIQKQLAIPVCSWRDGLAVMLKRIYQ